mmetsp:Transcript_31423/g.74675  ORF Transcript_31423/g.74675 Transcript_31423/m.74675 type:complete len:198 (+) Transcript_31423:63-656(+)
MFNYHFCITRNGLPRIVLCFLLFPSLIISWPDLPKPKEPPLGLGFDIYCRVCRHIFEVAVERVWDFRESHSEVKTLLLELCNTTPEFLHKEALARQVCPYLVRGHEEEITAMIVRLAGEGASASRTAVDICYSIHEACTSEGKASTVIGDPKKFRMPPPAGGPPPPPSAPAERRGPPEVSVEHARSLFKKRRRVELR